MRARRALLVALALTISVGTAAFTVPGWMGDGPWAEGSRHGPWRVVFTGFGVVDGAGGQVRLFPKPPAAGSPDTHAGLVVSQDSCDDVVLSARLRTQQQLRTPRPNPWEVAWLGWHYTAPGRFYSLVLKPNGWELTKQDASYPGGQRFLATGDSPTFAVGSWHDASVVQSGDVIKVSADGRLLASFTDTERPYTSGRVGLYTEDARVTFDQVQIRCLPRETRGASTP
jgi:hypothetical protein